MRSYRWYAVTLVLVVQIIAGCGGGGGGGGVVPPPVADTAAPTVNSFTMPAASTSMTVAISSLTATDNVAVTGYLVTENATAPSASAGGWTVSVPASFTFSSFGTKTVYAWAKDAAGNVSSSRQASVTITLPTTKTVTWKIYSQSITQTESITGFDLTVILPDGSVIPTEIQYIQVFGNPVPVPVVVPLSNAVFLSGKYAAAPPFDGNTIEYDNALRELKINYPTATDYGLGEFITIITTVPISYMPNVNDINIVTFKAYAPTGATLPSVTAIATFN